MSGRDDGRISRLVPYFLERGDHADVLAMKKELTSPVWAAHLCRNCLPRTSRFFGSPTPPTPTSPESHSSLEAHEQP